MPTYDYECIQCGRTFEVFQSISAKALRSIKTDCTKCRNKAPVRRLIGTGAAILFKGSGFYETDYRSDAYKKAAKAENESASPSKPGDKPSDRKTDKKTGASSPRSSNTGKSKPSEQTKTD